MPDKFAVSEGVKIEGGYPAAGATESRGTDRKQPEAERRENEGGLGSFDALPADGREDAPEGQGGGSEQEKLKIARNLIGSLDEETIAEKTELPLKTVLELKKKVESIPTA